MGQFVRANSRPGRRGYAGDPWQDPSGLNHGDFTPSWQDTSGLNHGDFTQPWQDTSGLNHGDFTQHPARRTVFPNAGGGNNQTINPFGGIGRVIGRGIRGLGNKLQGLRGWNLDGTPKTQLQWEEEREQRIAQKRINNILGRDAPATKATNINLNRLYNTLGTPKTGRNLFTEGEINRGISPAMRQIYQVPDYKLMDGQGLEGTTVAKKTASLRGNDDTIKDLEEIGKGAGYAIVPGELKGGTTLDSNFMNADWGKDRTTSLPVDKSSSMMAEEYSKPITQRWSNKTGANLQEAAAINPKLTESMPWYNKGVGYNTGNLLERGALATQDPTGEKGYMKTYNTLGGDLTISEALRGMQKGAYDKLPSGIQEKFQEQILDQIKAGGGYGDIFQENWGTGTVDPTFQGGRLDIDESELEVPELNYPKHFRTYKSLFAPQSIAQGGRVGYNTGGRVGILAAF